MNELSGETVTAIIGLGNPGPRFSFTHHNAGFLVVDALADKYQGIWHEKENMAIAEIMVGDRKIFLIKPLTFMNASGNIMAGLNKKGIKAENILVIHDELEKPFGALSFKKGGSHRGHNGLRSIINAIGPEFLRLRFGIGRPEDKAEVSEYVLSQFKQDPQEVADHVDKAVGMIEELIK